MNSSSSDEDESVEDEESLHEISLKEKELRRRIANRKRALVFLKEKPVRNTKIHPTVQHAMEESRSINTSLRNHQMYLQSTEKRTFDQHILTRSLSKLKTHLSDATRNVRFKKYALSGIENSLETLSKDVKSESPTKTYTRSRIRAELQKLQDKATSERDCCCCGKRMIEAIHQKHESHCRGKPLASFRLNPVDIPFQLCELCCKLVRPDALSKHREFCSMKEEKLRQLAEREKGTDTGWSSAPVPTPPENVRCEDSTSSSILLKWDIPVFTGAAIVHDYEISYSRCMLRESCGKQLRTYKIMPSVRTSRWNQVIPIAQGEFRLENLYGGTEYGRIYIRAITKHGLSRPSNEIKLVKTADTQPSSCPIYLGYSLVTDTSIRLHWEPPFHTHGADISEYEVRYKGLVLGDSADLRERKEASFVHKTDVTFYTIENLLSDSEYTDFQIIAVNALGMKSEGSNVIASITTKKKGLECNLLEQLDAAIQLNSSFIDSDFYNGFVQRYDRLYFIKLLSRTIKETHPEYSSRVDEMVPEEDSDSSSDDSSSDESTSSESSVESEPEVVTPVRQEQPMTLGEKNRLKTQQFYYRIGELERSIGDAEYNITWCKERRAELMGLLTSAEKRMHLKQAEFERARNFKGSEMDSAALHGKLQRFTTDSLIQNLEEELDIERYYIADTKQEMITVEKYLIKDGQTLIVRQNRLQERKNALKQFQLDIEDANNATRCLGRLQRGIIYKIILAWQRFVSDRKSQRELMNRVFQRIDMLQFRAAFDQWRKVTIEYDESMICPDGVIGIGGKSLALANRYRTNLETECSDILSSIRKTNAVLTASAKTYQQQKIAEKSVYAKEETNRKFYQNVRMKYWRQGDACMNVGDFTGAIKSYEAQLNTITELVDRGRLYSCIGHAMLRLKDMDHALLKYRQAVRIAKETSDRVGEAMASRGLAEYYVDKRAYSDAVNEYDNAFSAYEDLCDTQGQVAVLRGLEGAHSELGDVRNAKICRVRGDRIQFEMDNKLNNMNTRLDTMRKQLLSVTAQPKRQVVLERVGAIVPRLRAQRIEMKLKVVECMRQREAFLKLVEEKKKLIEEGEYDLKKAEASDSAMVDSSIITGAPARFEIENFRKKLTKLMTRLQIAQERIEIEAENARVRVDNLKEDISELELELESETGDLMRRVLSKKDIRKFKFNQTNRILQNITGKETGGIRTCIGSVDDSLIVFDTGTGVCMSLSGGERETQARAFEERRGHRKMIISMFYTGDRLYTGDMDSCLGVWQVQNESSLSLLHFYDQEFDANVTAVTADVAYIIVGCSDCQLFIFDAQSFKRLVRRYDAHCRTITCVGLDLREFATAGADGEIGLWRIILPEIQNEEQKQAEARAFVLTLKKPTVIGYSIELYARLKAKRKGDEWYDGHKAGITCLQFEGHELVSGDQSGVIIIWNVAKREPVRIVQVHTGPVTCLQFDTTRVLSGGNDSIVNMTDIPSGQVVQRLKGHTGRILDVQFDRTRLYAVATDGTIREWVWHSRTETHLPGLIEHIMGPGDTIRSVSIKYRVKASDILKWNNVQDVMQLYMGQRLRIQQSEVLEEKEYQVNQKFGKLILEDTAFMTGGGRGKIGKSEEQIMEDRQRLALEKEYFPPMVDSSSSSSNSEINSEGEDESVDGSEESDIELSASDDEG